MPGNLEDTMTITALVQCLIKALSDDIDHGAYQHDCHPMMVRQNKWRACRFGTAAQLVNSFTYEAEPVGRIVERLLERLRDVSKELDCEPYIDRVMELATRPGSADRQLKIFADTNDRTEVVRQLTDVSRVSAPS
jgi:carboxylate-amine ligase